MLWFHTNGSVHACPSAPLLCNAPHALEPVIAVRVGVLRDVVARAPTPEVRRLAAEVDASGELEGMPFPVPDEEDDARYA